MILEILEAFVKMLNIIKAEYNPEFYYWLG